MSHVDELVAELAPNGVEFRALGEVCTVFNGYAFKSAMFNVDGDGLPIIRIRDVNTGFSDTFYSGEFDRRWLVEDGDILIGMDGDFRANRWKHGRALLNQRVCRLQNFSRAVNPNFIYYQIQDELDRIQASSTGSTVKHLSSRELERSRIPVPPLGVQSEIVRILDQFTRLEAELEAELQARRAQRIALVNNVAVALRDQQLESAPMAFVTLGSLAQESIEPVKVQAEQQYVSLGVKWNGEGVIAREPRDGSSIKATTLYRARPGQLIYNRMFVVEGSFALVPDECDGAVVSGEFPLFELDTSRVEPEWLLRHLCNPHTLGRIEREVTGTERGSMKSRRRWKADQFRGFEILLPNLEAQRETLNVLRSSDALIRSLEDELAARRRQYEHYRDKLLTFEEASA